jgi:hypothetical protein
MLKPTIVQLEPTIEHHCTIEPKTRDLLNITIKFDKAFKEQFEVHIKYEEEDLSIGPFMVVSKSDMYCNAEVKMIEKQLQLATLPCDDLIVMAMIRFNDALGLTQTTKLNESDFLAIKQVSEDRKYYYYDGIELGTSYH